MERVWGRFSQRRGLRGGRLVWDEEVEGKKGVEGGWATSGVKSEGCPVYRM